MKYTISFLLVIFISTNLFGQDSIYTHKIIEALCSNKMSGRAYVKRGDQVAANYIAKEFNAIGLRKFGKDYFQEFTFSVNTFPSQMELIYNGKVLIPGIDYLVDPASPSIDFHGKVQYVGIKSLDSNTHYDHWGSKIHAAVIDTFTSKYFSDAAINLKQYTSDQRNILVVKLSNEKLTWSCSQKQSKVPVITLKSEVFNRNETANFEIKIKNKFIPKYVSRNVIGFIEGTKFKDSFIYVTAHYDHLGMMGSNTMFPGANDNASGIAMMLNLAKYFKINKPKYSIVFIAFSGEEAGLIGSHHYVENPLTPLSDIKFLVNLDLMGNGAEGVMVVNGTINPSEFQLLKSINEKEKYLPEVKIRGKAANSDHYWFAQSGVPAFFFYLMGKYPFYHDVNDQATALPLTNFDQAFMLFQSFISQLQNQ
jgi:hypothetical protein